MSDQEKRECDRKEVTLASFIRKSLPDGGYSLYQFMSKNLSIGGVFIVTDDLTLFDLGEEVALIVEQHKSRYYEGTARIVRSARIFESEGHLTESGFGCMFLEPDEDFTSMVQTEIESA